MPRPLKEPSQKAVQATVRLTPAAWARIDSLRSPGMTRAAAIEAMVWRDAQGTLPLEDSDGSNKRSIQERRKDVADALVAKLAPVVTKGSLFEQEIRGEPAPKAHLPSNCSHSKSSVINAGMRRCDGCGAIRGVGGVWRV